MRRALVRLWPNLGRVGTMNGKRLALRGDLSAVELRRLARWECDRTTVIAVRFRPSRRWPHPLIGWSRLASSNRSAARSKAGCYRFKTDLIRTGATPLTAHGMVHVLAVCRHLLHVGCYLSALLHLLPHLGAVGHHRLVVHRRRVTPRRAGSVRCHSHRRHTLLLRRTGCKARCQQHSQANPGASLLIDHAGLLIINTNT